MLTMMIMMIMHAGRCTHVWHASDRGTFNMAFVWLPVVVQDIILFPLEEMGQLHGSWALDGGAAHDLAARMWEAMT